MRRMRTPVLVCVVAPANAWARRMQAASSVLVASFLLLEAALLSLSLKNWLAVRGPTSCGYTRLE